MLSATHSNLRLVNVLHGIQFLVGSGVLGIGIYMMFFAKPRPRSNSGRWALSVAAKSLVIIAYQVLTTNVKACQRWASLKAYLILDVLEIVFWIAAVVLTVMGMTKLCAGVSCILSGVTVGLAVFLALLGLPVLYIAYKHWKHDRDEKADELDMKQRTVTNEARVVSKYESS